jgi:hypothetical protein
MPDVLHTTFEYPDKELTLTYSANLTNPPKARGKYPVRSGCSHDRRGFAFGGSGRQLTYNLPTCWNGV